MKIHLLTLTMLMSLSGCAGSGDAGYALHSLNDFDGEYLAERADGFHRDTSLCLLGDISFFYKQLLARLYNELEHEKVFSTDAFGFSMGLYDAVRDLQEKGLGSVQAFLEKDFDDFVGGSLHYRVALLGFLTENIRAIEEARGVGQDKNE